MIENSFVVAARRPSPIRWLVDSSGFAAWHGGDHRRHGAAGDTTEAAATNAAGYQAEDQLRDPGQPKAPRPGSYPGRRAKRPASRRSARPSSPLRPPPTRRIPPLPALLSRRSSRRPRRKSGGRSRRSSPTRRPVRKPRVRRAPAAEMIGYVQDNCGFGEMNVTAADYNYTGLEAEYPAGPAVVTLTNDGKKSTRDRAAGSMMT